MKITKRFALKAEYYKGKYNYLEGTLLMEFVGRAGVVLIAASRLATNRDHLLV
jgi:hypothetical protein